MACPGGGSPSSGTGCIPTTRFEAKAAMKTKAPDRLFVMGPGVKRLLRFGLPASQVHGRRSLLQALGDASPSALWMAAKPGATEELLHEAIRLPSRRRSRLGALLTFNSPRP